MEKWICQMNLNLRIDFKYINNILFINLWTRERNLRNINLLKSLKNILYKENNDYKILLLKRFIYLLIFIMIIHLQKMRIYTSFFTVHYNVL